MPWRTTGNTRIQAHRRRLLTELNLLTHPALARGLDGEPAIVVQMAEGGEPRYRASWGTSKSAAVTYLSEPPEYHFYGESLRDILADPAAYAWHALCQELERELGSALETQDVTGVSAFPEWAL